MSLYITKSQLEDRKRGNSIDIVNKHLGAGNVSNKSLTHDERVLIGTLAKVDTQNNVAETFGVSQPTVSYSSRGLTSTNQKNEELVEGIAKSSKEMKTEIRDKTLNALMTSLGIVEDKVGSAKTAAEASVVAKNLAIIHDKFSPSDSGNKLGHGVNILIHVPQQKTEKEYDVIDA